MRNFLLILLLTTLCLTACGTKEDSSAQSAPDAITYQLSIPKDFSKSEASGMEFYYAAEDGSNISLNLKPRDPDFDEISADLLNPALTSALSNSYDARVVITEHYFTTKAVCGFPAYQYCISYELEDTPITQIIVGIDADQTYTFTFTDLAGTWLTEFEKSILTIQIF